MIKVLIVDDDFMVAKVHAGFIQRTPGFTVVGVAHTGAKAVEETERLQPDLVLLDIHLPDINGLDLMQQLRGVAPELDVLVISAAREVETVRKALRGGIVHYLIKPFSQSDLQERLEHYRSAYQGLDSAKDVAEQSDVNRVFGLELDRTERPLPKGCSIETLKLVEAALKAAEGDVSAAEVAEQLGTSRVSARRYLEYLHDEGSLEVRLKYGVGRPERRYALKGQ
ncbi:response regulator [Pseudarthrobacter phenanthrenivorans]|uniref:Transcriptional regulatory protein n=2 Tax=Pseudarthrobacter phenanthrenivorans TaxID=361575 RepID=A0A3B0FR47_PSEPS|nr:response regulator [Pseudarthrobacter phenanthrenivorans]ADX71704.1 response regulator of citrate/malate metabolism [Pseudarthrobacter phenanthrenivorans Sphe3]RKO22305.1 response regulator [Pseudarthrobacter phenanthrenivorans]TPV50279.1 response regulator [Pseudarthrobacter phenanthrenivorans]